MQWILTLLVALQGFRQPGFTQECSVSLRVVNMEGVPSAYSVKAFADAEGREFSSMFSGLRGRVPCKKLYTFEVSRNGFSGPGSAIQGKLRVTDPDNWLTLTTSPAIVFDQNKVFAVDHALPDGLVWKGQILPPQADRPWIQIRSLFGTIQVETEADVNGAFRIYKVFPKGTYLLFVANSRGRLLYLAPIEILSLSPNDTLVIRLPLERPRLSVFR